MSLYFQAKHLCSMEWGHRIRSSQVEFDLRHRSFGSRHPRSTNTMQGSWFQNYETFSFSHLETWISSEFFYLVTNFYLSHVSRGKYFIRYNTIWNYFSIFLNERKKVGQMPNKTYPLPGLKKGLYNHKIPISIGIMAPLIKLYYQVSILTINSSNNKLTEALKATVYKPELKKNIR